MSTLGIGGPDDSCRRVGISSCSQPSQHLAALCLLFAVTHIMCSAISGVLWATFALFATKTNAQQNYTINAPNSVSFFPLRQNEGLPDQFPMPLCGSFQLEEATIDDMQQAMSNGQLTSTQLTLCYIQRIYQTQSYTK